MASPAEGNAASFPPGTVYLEEQQNEAKELFLQPQPSEDPNDPLNWSNLRKYVNFTLTCLYSLLITEFLCAATPTWGPMHDQLGFSWEILLDSYALGCGFLAIGAVLLTPFALKFGRRPMYLLSVAVTFGVSVWSAKMHTVADIMLVNALSCLFGALSEVIVQMTIADLFFVHQRGRMNAIFIWMVQIGASLGPLAAGYVTVSQGWRWVWWWNVILFGVCMVLFGIFYEETKYIPYLPGIHVGNEEPQTQQLVAGKEATVAETKSTSSLPDDHLKTTITVNHTISVRSYRQRLSLATSSPGEWKTFARHSWQPFMILATFPAVLFVALVYGVLIALQNALSTTMSSRMTEPPYSFSPNAIGLMNLAQFIGVTIGSTLIGPLSDRWIVWSARRNGGIYEPESRLWLLPPCIPLVLAGALMFGFGVERGLPWPFVAVGIAMVGDALVGVTVVRNAVNTSFIFALTPWFAEIGVEYVIMSLALISAFFLSFAAVFLKWGKVLRTHSAVRYREFSLQQFSGNRE